MQNFQLGKLQAWRTFGEAVEGLEERDLHHLQFPEERLRYYRLPGQASTGNIYLKSCSTRLSATHSYPRRQDGFLQTTGVGSAFTTLVTHPAMPATDLAHPEKNRPLSIEEYKRIQEFPDDWALQGPLLQQYKQVGNAVPASLGEALGRALIAHVEGRQPDSRGIPIFSLPKTDETTWSSASRTGPNARHAKRPLNESHPKLF